MSTFLRRMRSLAFAVTGIMIPAASAFSGQAGDSPTVLTLPYNSVPGEILRADQIDYYKFSGTAGAEIVLIVEERIVRSNLGGLLCLFDGHNKLLAYNDGDVNLPDDTSGEPILYVKLPATGDYYVSVSSAALRTGYSMGEPTGRYRLTLWAWSFPDRPGDPYEPNDSRASAHAISLPFRTDNANLQYLGDMDWFRFTAKKGTQYAIDIDALEMQSTPGWGMIVRPHLGLFDSSGRLLKSADSAADPYSGFVGDPALLFTAPNDGTYYIAVTAPGDGNFQGVFGDSSFLSDPYVNSTRYTYGFYQIEVTEVHKIFFPQLVNGAFGGSVFKTGIFLLNTSADTAAGSVSFYNSDGSPMALLIGPGDRVSTYRFNLQSKRGLALRTDGTGPGTSGYAVVISNLPVDGSAIFSEYDNGGILVTEAGVKPSQPMEFFAFPVDTTGDFNTGFALCNPNDRPVNLTLRLLDSAGRQMGSRSMPLGSGQQLAQMVAGAGQLFPSATSVRGSLQVLGDGPVGGVALRISPRTITTLDPVTLNQPFDPISVTFPQIVAGSSSITYRSTIILMNTGYLTVDGSVSFTRPDGTPMPVTINSATSSVYNFSAAPGSTTYLETSMSGPLQSGYASLTANHSLSSMAIISQFDGTAGTLQCESGITPAGSYSHFYLFAQTDEGYNTGVAVANPQASSTAVSFELRSVSDSSQVLRSDPMTLDARVQRAELVSGSGQLFPSFAGLGILEVTSAVPIPAMALRLSPTTMTALPVIPERN